MPDTLEPALVEIRGLTKTFRSNSGLRLIPVLRGVDLTVRRGEVVGFLGPNGAGKTTTIKILLGLVHPTSGHVAIDGRDVRDPSVRAHVGFLPEHPYFYDYLTVEELLRFAAEVHGLGTHEARPRIEAVIERLGLGERRGTALRKLSKGWLQRVGMAQALVNDPALLVLDEPMSGLDPMGRRQMRELIRALAGEGKTVLFSSHILADAELLCDRVAVIVDGRIQHSGSLTGFDPAHPEFVDVVLEGIPAAALASAPVTVAGPPAEREGCIEVRVGAAADVTPLLSWALAAGGRVVSVAPGRLGLEDIFARAVARAREGEP